MTKPDGSGSPAHFHVGTSLSMSSNKEKPSSFPAFSFWPTGPHFLWERLLCGASWSIQTWSLTGWETYNPATLPSRLCFSNLAFSYPLPFISPGEGPHTQRKRSTSFPPEEHSSKVVSGRERHSMMANPTHSRCYSEALLYTRRAALPSL